MVAAATVAPKEKTLLPATASPFVPSSKKVWVDEPPIWLRSPVTVIPVLVGFAPGVTVTVRSVLTPARTEAGVAAPTPVGSVGVGGAPQTNAEVAELRGAGGESAVKSAALSSVSVQPLPALTAEVVALRVGAAAVPSKKVAFP